MNKLLFIFLTGIVLPGCDGKKTQNKREGSVHAYTVPQFEDSASFSRMKEAFPVIKKLYKDYAEKNHFPSVAFGIIAGGQLIYAAATGTADVEAKVQATTSTLFRIASMSKSFTAMAILKLRDEGKLSLSDPLSKHIPQINGAGALTKDAPEITITHLLTMSAGFPEDNPWGDRQLADSDEELLQLVEEGISFSNVPGIQFEYSNLGFALLGKIVTNVSGMPYQQYITENIMKPIGMNDSRWEYEEVPVAQLARGYRWEDEVWKSEPLLHDGSYGAMGGLICSIDDFSKYVALHLNAWPPRNEAEAGPLKRSSIREMQQPWRFNGLIPEAKARTGEACPFATGYGYGLGWRQDCKGTVRISHGGGLPGFGSEWRIYPEYGIGVVSFSNRTYGSPGFPNAVALDTLIHIAGLKTRKLHAPEILETRREQIMKILPGWNDEAAFDVLAENFFQDQSLSSWRANSARVFKEAGAINKIGALEAENQLRGSFVMAGEKKDIAVFFTLTPEGGALIQQLDLEVQEKKN